MATGREVDLTRIGTLIENAEKVTSCIKNPQIRGIAFEKILDFLLSCDNSDIADKKGKKIKKKKGEKKARKTGLKSWIEEIIDEGFFKTPKNMRDILGFLEERGHHLQRSDVQPYLKIFMKEKKLRRKKQEETEGGKKVWHYSNW